MNENKKLIFFRNDDVRNSLDPSLVDLTMLCVKNKVPISHAVEPANLTQDVSDWLIEIKIKFPDFIEIIQHGYNHNLENPEQKMEFGGSRGYHDQYNDIKKGKEIMDRNFGNLWNPVFTFPYGAFNAHTLKAIDDLGYKTISSKIKFTYKARLKNSIGRLMHKDMLLGKKINYHPDVRNGYKFREISVSANLIKRYTGQSTADHYLLEDVINQIRIASIHTNIIGVLFHHRFHADYLNLIFNLIDTLKRENYFFTTIEGITLNIKT